MAQPGNEGDQILFLAFTQIECNIPPEIDSVAKLTPDLVVEIIVRSLALISNGEIKVRRDVVAMVLCLRPCCLPPRRTIVFLCFG